jgi:hypothetical protein
MQTTRCSACTCVDCWSARLEGTELSKTFSAGGRTALLRSQPDITLPSVGRDERGQTGTTFDCEWNDPREVAPKVLVHRSAVADWNGGPT